jgi:peroxiredoxin
LACGCSTFGTAGAPATLELSQIHLNAPPSPKAKEYLGLQEKRTFALSEIDAKIIVMGYYAIKCPFCHEQAPVSNKIYDMIGQDPELSRDVKMVGVMVGSNPEETATYAHSMNILYPMTNDPFFDIYRKLGKTGVPLTLVMTRDGTILLRKTGVIADPEGLVKKIRQFNGNQ